MKERVDISIAKQFSKFPGGRLREDGPYNGTAFREDFLVPPLRAGKRVVVSLDGVAGVASSFLDEAFVGLVRIEGFDKEELAEQLELVCDDEVMVDFVEVCKEMIRRAEVPTSESES